MGSIAQALGTERQKYGEWVTPDHIWKESPDFVTVLYGDVFQYSNIFLYRKCNQNNKRRYGEHYHVVLDYLNDHGADEDDLDALRHDGRDAIDDICLLGRQGMARERDEEGGAEGTHKFLSFWNTDSGIYDRLLMPCLAKMKSEGIYDPSVMLSTPFGSQKLSDVMGTGRARTRELSDDEKERVAMQRRMHLAGGEEKKAIRKALGLWSDKPAEPGLHGQMMKHRFDPEVAKWWTPECNLNFQEWLNG